jgi:hypothetical protein
MYRAPRASSASIAEGTARAGTTLQRPPSEART